MSVAIVIGSGGQDGTLLCQLLQSRGDEVKGVRRGDLDLSDAVAVRRFVESVSPDQIYYLAAHHHASRQTREDTAELYRLSHAVHVEGLLNVLTAIRDTAPKASLFYAASSHVFGRPVTSPQDEKTPLSPTNIYGVTKVAATHLCRLFRNDFGVRASVGFLYNHESILRKPQFVSQRIVRGAVAVARGEATELELDDLTAVVDWGDATDTVDAMARIVAAEPGEYVVATGVPHTVEDFAREAFAAVQLDYQKYVRSRSTTAGQAVPLVGNPAKLKSATGWTPAVSFEQMVRNLVRHAEKSHG